MRKVINSFVAIIMLGAMCFLGGEWPEDTPCKKVVTCDAAALAIVFSCGLYFKKAEERDK